MIAVIEAGSKQYIVEKGQKIQTELLGDEKAVEFKPLMIIDGDNVQVGKPVLENAVVKATVAEDQVKGKKVVILKYKAKKRQSTKTGHRQKYAELTITDIKA
jgi:large subunit ribosomal protein L21